MCKYRIILFLLVLVLFSCGHSLNQQLGGTSNANPILYDTQFVGHARYYSLENPENSLNIYKQLVDMGYKIIECDVLFTKDNIPVLSHEENLCNLAHDIMGAPVNKEIESITFSEIEKYNFSINDTSFVGITTFEQIIRFAKLRNICVQVDIQKHEFGVEKCKILYDIVAKSNMKKRVIWEVSENDFPIFISFDKHLVYQLDETWSYDKIEECFKHQNDADLIILSKWFPNFEDIDEYKQTIDYGHQNGFLMKCAVINDTIAAKKFLLMGVDLMPTDCLQNNLLKECF